VWALWSEHCRLHPQGGAPDILALEIVMDAAARAQRSDLVYHVLWPRAMALRIVPTPAMWLILLKCAALLASSCRGHMRTSIGSSPQVCAAHGGSAKERLCTSLTQQAGPRRCLLWLCPLLPLPCPCLLCWLLFGLECGQ
jgi:hypothetical protein